MKKKKHHGKELQLRMRNQKIDGDNTDPRVVEEGSAGSRTSLIA